MSENSRNGAGADFTRWNRAGLRRFRYVQGNAADYLELLRENLERRFVDGDPDNSWAAVWFQGTDADEAARRRRVLEQYRGERRDYAWEIARVFARACHVLSETVDAYANEGYLETATQWDLLRRQVEMLGYTPSPPSSAATALVLLAKPGVTGFVSRGFQTRFSPVDGSAPVVFETVADLVVADGLNALRPLRWNRSEECFNPFYNPGGSPAEGWGPDWCKGPDMELSVGQVALLRQQPQVPAAIGAPAVTSDIRVVELAAVDQIAGAVFIAPPAGTQASNSFWYRGYTQLLASPKKVYRPHLNGPGLVRLDRPHDLAVGECIAWNEGGKWRFSRVIAAQQDRLRLANGIVPSGLVYRALRLTQVSDSRTGTTEFRVPLGLRAAAAVAADGAVQALDTDSSFKQQSDKLELQGYRVLAARIGTPEALLVVGSADPAIARVDPLFASTDYVFDGAPAGLKSGDWVVAEFRLDSGAGILRAARVALIVTRESDFTVRLQNVGGVLDGGGGPADVRPLICQLRRVEAILDEPIFKQTRLEDLANGTLRHSSPAIIEGVGALGSHPASYADALAAAGITTVESLAALGFSVAVPGIPTVRLREIRTHAEHLMRLPAELPPAGALLALRLPAIVAMEGLAARASSGEVADGSLERVYGPFQNLLSPTGHDRNNTPLSDPARLILALKCDEVPQALRPGRQLLLEQDGGDPHATHQTTLKSIDLSGSYAAVTFSEVLPSDAGFTFGNTVLRANVVAAGHGETKGERLLGSGNAAVLNQEFVFDVPGVSSVADSTLPSGTRADIEVVVEGQAWLQVASLGDSGPADCHYTVRMTEHGALRIGFGDGQHGRRLLTGSNNLRIRYRVGVGLGGNLAAYSLDKPAKPHRLIAAVRQPLPALGGNDMEGVDSLRSNAPASLLTLGRAVSLDDYANLSAAHSSIWQARAFAHCASLGRKERIEVVIVPANGAPLDDSWRARVPPYVLEEQRAFLQAHAPAGVSVTVTPFEPLLVDLRITVHVKFAEFDQRTVVDNVRVALTAAFALKVRRLGEALQQGEVYKAVEDVKGVEYSNCTISLTSDANGTPIQTVSAKDRQVVYLDPVRSNLTIAATEYVL